MKKKDKICEKCKCKMRLTEDKKAYVCVECGETKKVRLILG